MCKKSLVGMRNVRNRGCVSHWRGLLVSMGQNLFCYTKACELVDKGVGTSLMGSSCKPACAQTRCWGFFFRPTWHYFIGNLCYINILLIFLVNLFKFQNKLIAHSTTWIGLTWPARSLLQEADSWSTFPLHQFES